MNVLDIFPTKLFFIIGFIALLAIVIIAGTDTKNKQAFCVAMNTGGLREQSNGIIGCKKKNWVYHDDMIYYPISEYEDWLSEQKETYDFWSDLLD